MDLNKIHSLNRIQNAYKSIYTKLAQWKLIYDQPNFAERIVEAFHLLFPNQATIVEVANTYTKRLIRVEADTVLPFLERGKRINKTQSSLS